MKFKSQSFNDLVNDPTPLLSDKKGPAKERAMTWAEIQASRRRTKRDPSKERLAA